MHSAEDRMENLQMDLLEAPDDDHDRESPDLSESGFMDELDHEDEDEDGGGMIDIPFELSGGN